MISAMARLPCKQGPGPQQPSRHLSQGQQRTYWEVQPVITTTPVYARSHNRRHSEQQHLSKRKSAVELLQESKAFYVKSETVLDRKQELKNSGHLQVSQVSAPAAPPRLLRKCAQSNVPSQAIHCANAGYQQQQQQHQQQNSTTQTNQAPPPPCCWAAACHENERPALPPKSPRLVPVPQRRNISIGPATNVTQGEQLQMKLRRLLNTDSKENVFFPNDQIDYSGQSNDGNIRDESIRYSPGSLSPGYRVDDRSRCALPEVGYKFGRSNSHSHGHRTSRSSPQDIVITASTTCHKSLPDLHTSSSNRRRASLSPRSRHRPSPPIICGGGGVNTTVGGSGGALPTCPDCETSSDYSEHSFKRDSIRYRSSRIVRRSPGSGCGDASSVLSSGGRTHKSSGSSRLSHGQTGRDSGGSSGHCTHRSEPPPRLQDCWSHGRRDSGASTQHSTDRDRSRKSSYNGSILPQIARHYSPESESSDEINELSPTRNSRFAGSWKEGRGRPILRSKSDISDRYWRHEQTMRNTIKSNPPCRPPRSLTQLESFFDRLGLDAEDYQRISQPDSRASSPIFFDSVSSVDSALGLYSWTNGNEQWRSNCPGIGANPNVDENPPRNVGDQPSIVERNARIIKWLCQCRKQNFGFR